MAFSRVYPSSVPLEGRRRRTLPSGSNGSTMNHHYHHRRRLSVDESEEPHANNVQSATAATAAVDHETPLETTTTTTTTTSIQQQQQQQHRRSDSVTSNPFSSSWRSSSGWGSVTSEALTVLVSNNGNHQDHYNHYYSTKPTTTSTTTHSSILAMERSESPPDSVTQQPQLLYDTHRLPHPYHQYTNHNDNYNNNSTTTTSNSSKPRRAIFGTKIQQQLEQQRHDAVHWKNNNHFTQQQQQFDDTALYQIHPYANPPDTSPPGSPISGQSVSYTTTLTVRHEDDKATTTNTTVSPLFQPDTVVPDALLYDTNTAKFGTANGSLSPIQRVHPPPHHSPNKASWIPPEPLSPLTPMSPGHGRRIVQLYETQQHEKQQHSRKRWFPFCHHHRPHETIHAQSLLLGVAFACVWSPSNMMAPNLTEMADTFGFTDAPQRDLYLGSYCALATGVLSFPIAAVIGIWADVCSRRHLFVATVAGGAAASLVTAVCTQYWQLLLARLLQGGFMAGAVPVAFSFLGDLFATEERNAASSGLTAMMGMGIIAGQVYAGMTGPVSGWPHAFVASSRVTAVVAVLCALLVQEPVRGGKEKVLQEMLRAGTRYERKLTWNGFCQAMRNNESNSILLWQGFFSSLPWGIIFVFLNDYLSQERGFSVPDATYLVLVFGLGCAAGGVLGGYAGQIVQSWDRSYLPFFMALTTTLGIVPFLALLNSHFTNAHGVWGLLTAGSGGLIASLPSVNVRPCLINVNPPETRGASLTAANLLINLGRGVGPSCVTLMGTIWHVDRQYAFNVTLFLFWMISAIQLLLLAKTLPKDQDAMEADLASYAALQLQLHHATSDTDTVAEESIVSIEDRMIAFDGVAARETIAYVREGIKEMNPFQCGASSSSDDDDDHDLLQGEDGRITPLRTNWLADQLPTLQQQLSKGYSEETPLISQTSERTTYGL